jgi:hypothetical protein
VNAAIRFGQQRPGETVGEDADSGENGQDDQDAANDQGIDAETVGYAAGHTADPAVASAVDALAADPVEEIL